MSAPQPKPVPNQSPNSSITAPANGTTVTAGDNVTFQGTGSDPEDGALSGASLVWTSSLDGQIGTGTSFMTSALRVGVHTITLTATDSQGATGTATIQITVQVVAGQVTSLSVDPDLLVLDVGSSSDLVVDARDQAGNPVQNPNLQTMSGNTGVATVSGTTVTGVAPGVTDVTVTADQASDVARVAVAAQTGFAAVVTNDTNKFRVSAAPGSMITLQLWMVAPPMGTGNLASVQGSIGWDTTQLSFQSATVLAPFAGNTNPQTGSLAFALFRGDGLGSTGTFAVLSITFQVTGTAGSTAVLDLTVDAAGDELGSPPGVQVVDSAVEIQ